MALQKDFTRPLLALYSPKSSRMAYVYHLNGTDTKMEQKDHELSIFNFVRDEAIISQKYFSLPLPM